MSLEENATRTNHEMAKNSSRIGPWHTASIFFELTTILELVSTTWLLVCVVVYGTKTRRWTKGPGASNRNSGMIYSACTVTIALFMPRLITTEALHRLSPTQYLNHCELICDFGNGTFAVAVYSFYFFLWMKQRVLYSNRYVKERVSSAVNYLSVFSLVILTTVAIALACFYVVPTSFSSAPQGCILRPIEKGSFMHGVGKNIMFSISVIISDCMILSLCIYTAVRVRVRTGMGEEEEPRSASAEPRPPRKQIYRRNMCFDECFGNLISPIELDVRRTLLSGIIMIISDVLAIGIASTALARDTPVSVRQSIYDMGLFINVFCVIATFGNLSHIVTVLRPRCVPFRTITPEVPRQRSDRPAADEIMSSGID